MNTVLLTVSGSIPADIERQVAEGKRPRPDYLAMAESFGADLVDFTRARALGGRLGRWLERIGGGALLLAWVCFRLRKRYRVIFTDGEQIGIPLAFLLKFLGGARGARHLMIVHILSVGKKMLMFDLFRLQTHIDIFFAYSSWQKRFIETRWKVPAERVVFTPFMVDADFFAPERAVAAGKAADRPTLCAVGLEFRDYPTLVDAVDGLDVRVIIAAASPWSKRANEMEERPIPENVSVRRFSQFELRQVYADADLVVMPLYNVEFQAGVTAILEGMAMGKAVICTRTPGQTDVIVDGVNGLYVPPGDAAALRAAICALLADGEKRERLGKAGRATIEAGMSLEHYVVRLGAYVQG